jgi:hypothetical protein
MFWGKKKDHSATIEKIALSLVQNGQNTGVIPFLSLKQAADYAKDKSPLCSPEGCTISNSSLILWKGYT